MQNLTKHGIKDDTPLFEKSHHGILDLLVFYWETTKQQKQQKQLLSNKINVCRPVSSNKTSKSKRPGLYFTNNGVLSQFSC